MSEGAPADSREDRWVPFACLAGAAALAGAYRLHTGLVNDDALITIRYAENAATGLGLVYNEGGRTLGTTTPLWALLLTAFRAAGLPLVPVAAALGCLAHGVTAAAAAEFVRGRGAGRLAALSAGALVAGCPPLVHWAASGMESGLAAALLALFVVAFERGRTAALGWIGGAMVLTRPDLGLVLATAALLDVVRTRSLRGVLRAAPGFGALVLPWLAWATWYYGSPLPNSGFAKRFQVEDWGSYGVRLLDVLGENAALLPFAVAGVAAGLASQRALPAFALAATVAGMHLGGMPGCGWYMVVPMLLLALLAAAGAAEVASRLSAAGAPAVLAGACAVAPLVTDLRLPRAAHDAKISQAEIERLHGAVGNWLRDHAPSGASVGVDNIGYIGWRSGLRVVDMLGLVDREVAEAVGRGERDWALRHRRPELIAIWWGRGNTWKYRPPDAWFAEEGYRRVFAAPLRPDRPEPAYVVWSRVPVKEP